MKIKTRSKCSACAEHKPLNYFGPCQKCGVIPKTHEFFLQDILQLSDSIRRRHIREYNEKNNVFFLINNLDVLY